MQSTVCLPGSCPAAHQADLRRCRALTIKPKPILNTARTAKRMLSHMLWLSVMAVPVNSTMEETANHNANPLLTLTAPFQRKIASE